MILRLTIIVFRVYMMDETISNSNKISAIVKGVLARRIEISDLETFLKSFQNKKVTDYKKLLCVYDYVKYYT